MCTPAHGGLCCAVKVRASLRRALCCTFFHLRALRLPEAPAVSKNHLFFVWGSPPPEGKAHPGTHLLLMPACSLVPSFYGRQFRGAWHLAKPWCRDQPGLEMELENGESKESPPAFWGWLSWEGAQHRRHREQVSFEDCAWLRAIGLPCSFSPLLSTISAGEHLSLPGIAMGLMSPTRGCGCPSQPGAPLPL